MFNVAAAGLLAVTLVSAEIRQAKYELWSSCVSDSPQTVLSGISKMECAVSATGQRNYRGYNFDQDTKHCSLYKHKPLFYAAKPDCKGYKAR